MNTNVVIDFLLHSGALTFGDFTTKSGRKTPYFLNTGNFFTAYQIHNLAQIYKNRIAEAKDTLVEEKKYDSEIPLNLFGPAYKGIPLVASIASEMWSQDVTYTFNRKEAKDHGEGGSLVGDKYKAPRNVLIVEDVITAGTSIRETMDILAPMKNASVKGVVILCDRMEIGQDTKVSAVQQVQQDFGFSVYPVITILDIMAFLGDKDRRRKFGIADDIPDRMQEYWNIYGVGK